ncbi:hypothetical protein BCEP4_800005 [Burkholderia cepacia]|nr:hypothetical protein BCEP4_800005 [Burkholderia cepacia]
MRILRADLLQSPPFSEERCDGPLRPPGSESFTKQPCGARIATVAPAPLPERRSRHQSRNFLERRA